jgi:hypothetical protein
MNYFQEKIQSLVSWAFTGGKQMDEYEVALINRQKMLNELKQYYDGRQRRPLKPAPLGKDYNVLANLTGIIVNRSVSMLVGTGVDFNIKDKAAHEYIDNTYAANKGDILLHDLAQFGSIYGTPFIKIVPGAREWNGDIYSRLVALNPINLIIKTAPNDIENVTAYVYRWNDGEIAWREITEKNVAPSDDVTQRPIPYWIIRTEKSDKETKGEWIKTTETKWDYPFSPIQHSKNLPLAGSVYGMSDIEGVIELQDRYNASQSDINVILGNNAFPLRYVSGGKLPRLTLADGSQVVDISPQKIIEFGEGVTMGTAEMESDLTSSRQFSNDLRRDIFDISATVDSETLRENASSITNFGLKIMYKDEIEKNNTKKMLYGDLLCTVNKNLLTMAGLNNDPGTVTWGDPLPVNEKEEIEALTADKALGIVSDETISQIRNYDFADEQAKLAKEKSQRDALGGNILRDFLAGNNRNNQ